MCEESIKSIRASEIDMLRPAKNELEITSVQQHIVEECNAVKDMLLGKNRKYGNSALEPKRIFSKASAIEQLNVRIDDKLSRIMSAQNDEDEDVDFDLIGYLILRRVARKVL